MKAIIVDDEAHVREAIQLLAKWNQYGIDTILEASNGEEAMEIIKTEQPEIIFTDMMMPVKDGVALMQWIHRQDYHNKIIVISGFDDYKYMRTAIHYGSYDYILKPVDEKILNHTLQEAVKEWHREEDERNLKLDNSIKLNEVKNIYFDHLFTHLLRESSNHSAIYKKIKKELNIDSDMECQVVIVYLNTYTREKYQGNMELLYFSLLNIFNELLRKNNMGIAFRNINKDDEIILLAWSDLSNFKLLTERMCRSVFNTLKLSCIFAMGIKSRIISLHQSYEAALHVLNKVNLLNTGKRAMVPVYDQHDLSADPIIHLLDYSHELGLAISSGNKKHLTETLNEIFTKLKNNKHLSLEQLDIWEKEYQILKKHWLDKTGIKSRDIQDERVVFWDEQGNFLIEKFEEEKYKQFDAVFSLYHKELLNKEKNILHEIKQYLEDNYQRDIKLHHISKRFYLSREYISRKFKQEYHENISEYMVNIRMNKAQELLAHTDLAIRDISRLVGYQDEKYFSKVFKKYTGFTPNDFRKSTVK